MASFPDHQLDRLSGNSDHLTVPNSFFDVNGNMESTCQGSLDAALVESSQCSERGTSETIPVHGQESCGQTRNTNVPRHPYRVQRAISDPLNHSSSHPSVTSNPCYAQTSTSLQTNTADPNHESPPHPLSHLGAGRFWSPTKESNSWVRRVWQSKRSKYIRITEDTLSPITPPRDLLAESAEWLDQEYPINPGHMTIHSDSQGEHHIRTSRSMPGEGKDKSQQAQNTWPMHHSVKLSERQQETRRQLEMIRQEDQSRWKSPWRLTELDSPSPGPAELEWANLQELPVSDTPSSKYHVHGSQDMRAYPRSETPASGCSAYNALDPHSPVSFEGGKGLHETSLFYDPPETLGTLEVVERPNEDASCYKGSSLGSSDFSAPIPVSHIDCSDLGAESLFAGLDRIARSRLLDSNRSR